MRRGLALALASISLLAGTVPALADDTHVDADAQGIHLAADIHLSAERAHVLAERILRRAPAFPTLPALIENGAVEVRAAFVQPVLRGESSSAGVAWIAAASETPWIGAIWIETELGASSPQIVDLDADGTIVFADIDATLPLDAISITYHMLGADGTHARHTAGRAPVLETVPTLGRAAFGGAAASARAAGPDLLLATPWNLVGRPVPMGLTLFAENERVHEVTLPACTGPEQAAVEPGCRHLYVMLLAPHVTHISVWHAEGNERIEGHQLSRATLAHGWTLVES